MKQYSFLQNRFYGLKSLQRLPTRLGVKYKASERSRGQRARFAGFGKAVNAESWEPENTLSRQVWRNGRLGEVDIFWLFDKILTQIFRCVFLEKSLFCFIRLKNF